MLPLSRLVHEVHRRGLWQAMAAFLGMGWAVLEVMDLFTSRGLLPDWTFTGALVVLGMGLPVVLATAFAQTSKEDTPRAATAPAGPDVPGPMPSAGSLRRFLTWRRAFLGGMAAFALLGASAAVFGIMRVTGVGAPGTLLAQGVLEEGDQVILADFQSTAGTAAPSDLVTEALRIDLEQSPTFDLMDPRAVSAGLARMVRDPNEPFSEEVALELAVGEGAEVVVGGEIGSVGGGYLLTGRILSAQDGSVLAAFRETARDSTQLIDAIDALSGKVRSKMGEAFRSVAASEPLAQATTGSLEALRKFSFVAQREPRGALSGQRAQQVIQEAVALDTTFAEAYRYLSILVNNYGGSVQLGADAAARAYRHRGRLPMKQQLLVEANYHLRVTGDYPQAARAYRGLLELDSLDAVSAINLADVAMYEGNYQEAEGLLRRTPRPDNLVWSWNLMAALSGQKRFAEAEEHLDRTVEAQPENVYLTPTRALFFAVTGQPDKALAEIGAASDIPLEIAAWLASSEAVAHAQAGRMSQVRARLARADALHVEHGDPSNRITFVAPLGFVEAWMAGDSIAGREALYALLDDLPLAEMEPVDRAHGRVALLFALMGAPEDARRFVELYRSQVTSLGDPDGRTWATIAEALASLQTGASAPQAGLEEAAASLRCRRCEYFYLGQGYEWAGDTDRAIDAYEAFVADGFFDASLFELHYPGPVVHERLGALHEEAGDPVRAAQHYREFAVSWRDADPELQPRVAAAMARAVALEEGG